MEASFDRKRIPSEMLQLLTDIGYVATGCGKKSSAECIFKSVVSARPDNEYAYIASAFMHMVFGEYTEASRLLVEGALKVHPDSEMARTFYAFLLHQVGQRAQSRIILDDVMSTGKDDDAIQFANKIIKEG